MKIAVDFDDVIVRTTQAMLDIYNGLLPLSDARWTLAQLDNWYLPGVLGLTQEAVRNLYAQVDYTTVKQVPWAITAIQTLTGEGHSVVVLTANEDYNEIRLFMGQNGLRRIPLFAGIGHKAGWCRDNDADILVDDSPGYLKGARTVGIHAIRFERPWNSDMRSENAMPWGDGEFEYSARNWTEVVQRVRLIAQRQLQGRVGEGSKWIEFAEVVEDVVTNAKGGKQTDIKRRYDLIPADALDSVAGVFYNGAKKYDTNNWKNLSVNEILNHLIAHAYAYKITENMEDLSHMATRGLMALQIAIEEQKDVKPTKV
jgi:hypothetical protein